MTGVMTIEYRTQMKPVAQRAVGRMQMRARVSMLQGSEDWDEEARGP